MLFEIMVKSNQKLTNVQRAKDESIEDTNFSQ